MLTSYNTEFQYILSIFPWSSLNQSLSGPLVFLSILIWWWNLYFNFSFIINFFMNILVLLHVILNYLFLMFKVFLTTFPPAEFKRIRFFFFIQLYVLNSKNYKSDNMSLYCHCRISALFIFCLGLSCCFS